MKKPSVEPSALQTTNIVKRNLLFLLVIPRGIEPLLPA